MIALLLEMIVNQCRITINHSGVFSTRSKINDQTCSLTLHREKEKRFDLCIVVGGRGYIYVLQFEFSFLGYVYTNYKMSMKKDYNLPRDIFQ